MSNKKTNGQKKSKDKIPTSIEIQPTQVALYELYKRSYTTVYGKIIAVYDRLSPYYM